VDWLTFIGKIIGDLVWPAVAVFLLLLRRPYLGGLARRLEELTLPGGARAKFREELEAAREQAIPVLGFTPRSLTAAQDGDVAEGGESQFLHLAAMFPEAAILQSYQEIERIMMKYASDPPLASAALVKAALEGGGADNISVIVVRIGR